MSAQLAIQQALYSLLRGDATLRTLLAEDASEGSPTAPAIYDHVPQIPASEDVAKFPYVVIGDDTAIPADTDDVDGQETTVTLHVWDRRRGRKRVKQVLDALYNLLHEASLTVSQQNFVYCFWEFSESIPDADVLSQHAVTRFRIVTQER